MVPPAFLLFGVGADARYGRQQTVCSPVGAGVVPVSPANAPQVPRLTGAGT